MDFRHWSFELTKSASIFLTSAIDQLGKSIRTIPEHKLQVLTANVCVSIELLIKGYIANVHPILLLKESNDDLRIFLLNRKALPENTTTRLDITGQLNPESHQLVDFSKAISLFAALEPEFYSENKKAFQLTVASRNQTVHSTLSDRKRLIFEVSLHLATRLSRHLVGKSDGGILPEILSNKRVNRFLQDYDKELREKLNAKVNLAKDSLAKNGKRSFAPPTVKDVFSEVIHGCPVCGSLILMEGYTTPKYDYQKDREVFLVYLTMKVESFHCPACGVKIEDYEELRLLDSTFIFDVSLYSDSWFKRRDTDTVGSQDGMPNV